MNKAEVSQLNSGVKITFSGTVAKQNVVEMVERCQTGKRDCMSDESKKKIEGMQVTGKDGDVELTIDGDLDVSEIQAAVAKSPLIND